MTFEKVTNIPVFAGPERERIGSASIERDGTVNIQVRPEMLGRNPDLRVVEQIHAFYLHYNYTLPNPEQPLPPQELGTAPKPCKGCGLMYCEIEDCGRETS